MHDALNMELILLSVGRPSKLGYIKVGSICGDSVEPSAVYNSDRGTAHLGRLLLLQFRPPSAPFRA